MVYEEFSVSDYTFFIGFLFLRMSRRRVKKPQRFRDRFVAIASSNHEI